jgi:dTDP-4-amino-4,6-dideoxygalactose transaminase
VTVRTEFVPILDLKPEYESLKGDLQKAINRVVESGQFIMGPDVKAFEAEVAQYLGVKHAIGVNSGTDALFIGLRALGIGPGDEVITTPFTFFATAEAISHVGATPVFVDIDKRTFNIAPGLIEEKITGRTKAILPVHLFGRPVEMSEIMELAERHNLKVVEDCAQSFGARYEGRQTGTFGDVGAYSFFPSKNLGAYGDGGLIATDDDALADAASMLRTHGAKRKYHNELVGYNSRLDTIQAAVLRVKLPHIDAWNEGRRRVAALYGELLGDVPGVTVSEVSEGHVFHQYTIRVVGRDRDEVQVGLKEAGISTMVYYPVPVHQMPLYRELNYHLPLAEKAAGEVLSLPIWPDMEETTQQRVVKAIKQALVAEKQHA